MRWVDRKSVAPPSYLSSSVAGQSRKLLLDYLKLDDTQRDQTRVPDRHLPSDPSLDRSLRELFLGKCAFCESRTRTKLYRFRPTSDAQPRDSYASANHLYYAWLSDAWQNLYPICADCRPRNMEHFPVKGERSPVPSVADYAEYVDFNDGVWRRYLLNEQAILIDPSGELDRTDELSIDSSAELLAKTESAAETIKHFKLNRRDLVRRRRNAFAGYLAEEPVSDDAEFAGLFRLWHPLWAEQVAMRRGGIPEPAQEPALKPVPETATAIAPRLTGVVVKNFKALENLSLHMPFDPASEIAHATLILGENATGKSSILEAVALCLMTDNALSALAEPPKKYLLDPSLMGEIDAPVRREASVTLTFDDETTRTLKVSAQGFSVSGAEARQPVYAYGAYRHYLKVKRKWSPERPVVSLFRSDNLLSNPESWLLGLNDDRFNEVVRALREIFGAAETFDVIQRDHRIKSCFVVAHLRDGRTARTPLSSVSSGFRTILALTCDVLRWAMDSRNDPFFESLVTARGVVLIDEVEAHLHPRWKIQIMTGLRRALPKMTFIATTHDPLCLRGMGEGEVKVLQRVKGQENQTSLPVQVETLTNLPNVASLTIEQLLTSDLFGLYSAEDPRTEERLAKLADYLTGGEEKRADPAVKQAWRDLRDEIGRALPIGLGEAGRIVHEVVAEYLVARRDESDRTRLELRARTKARIRARLDEI